MSAATDADHIIELFAAFGPISVRRMFGGAGIFSEGMMLGLIHQGVIFLKADARTIPAFEREGLGPFTYKTKHGARSIGSYWRMPERLYDDPGELASWAAQAFEAARRSASRKESPPRRRADQKRPRRQTRHRARKKNK